MHSWAIEPAEMQLSGVGTLDLNAVFCFARIVLLRSRFLCGKYENMCISLDFAATIFQYHYNSALDLAFLPSIVFLNYRLQSDSP